MIASIMRAAEAAGATVSASAEQVPAQQEAAAA